MGIACYVIYRLWDLGTISYLYQSTYNTQYSVVFGGNSIGIEKDFLPACSLIDCGQPIWM